MPSTAPGPSDPGPPAQSRVESLAGLRVLAVDGDPQVLQSVRAWVEEMGAQLEHVPDLPRAARQLAAARWNVVLAVLGERPDEELTWWAESLRTAEGAPRLIALATGPSMGMALRAEQLGVLDVLTLPVRKEQIVRSLARVRY